MLMRRLVSRAPRRLRSLRKLSESCGAPLVDAIRESLVDDVAPPNLGEMRWSPSLEQIREETAMVPIGTILPESKEDPFLLVEDDLNQLSQGMRDLVKTDHPLLSAAANHFFDLAIQGKGGGKKFRAAMVLLVAKAAHCQAKERTMRLAEIVEMIHTASLFHDDVIDGAATRRGVSSLNAKFGDKVAILAGDFLLARACVALSRLGDLQVVELLATVIEHLVRGEIVQMRPALTTTHTTSDRLEQYLLKNFYKTGSLIANSCRASIMLSSEYSHTVPNIRDAVFEYGRHLGCAFQLIDDVLDFEQSDKLGKPALNDLRQGLATAPTLLAAKKHPQLETLIARRFKAPGDTDLALDYVADSDAIFATKQLAIVQAELAVTKLHAVLPPTPARTALTHLAAKVVYRNH